MAGGIINLNIFSHPASKNSSLDNLDVIFEEGDYFTPLGFVVGDTAPMGVMIMDPQFGDRVEY